MENFDISDVHSEMDDLIRSATIQEVFEEEYEMGVNVVCVNKLIQLMRKRFGNKIKVIFD